MMPVVKVMVFLHGTAIMHATAVGRTRAERVRQSSQRDPSVLDFGSYVPLNRRWRRPERRHGLEEQEYERATERGYVSRAGHGPARAQLLVAAATTMRGGWNGQRKARHR